MHKQRVFWIFLIVLLLAALLWGPIMSRTEQARYTIIEKHDNIELREYAPMIVAETETFGERKEAINKGFRIIADYIFGNNHGSQKVAMTAPVIQEQGQKIAMTAPVTQQGDGKSWKIRFVMPNQYTLDTLPKPNNNVVQLVEIPARRFASIRFSGLAGTDDLKRQEDELKAYLQKNDIKIVAPPTYAFYDPPWNLPFLRRNEVMIQIK